MGPFTLLLSGIAFFIYGTICVVSIIFTFYLNFYHRIDQTLKLNVVSARTITPLEQNFFTVDDWLIKHNRSMGGLLTILSLVDMKLSFDVINMLGSAGL